MTTYHFWLISKLLMATKESKISIINVLRTLDKGYILIVRANEMAHCSLSGLLNRFRFIGKIATQNHTFQTETLAWKKLILPSSQDRKSLTGEMFPQNDKAIKRVNFKTCRGWNSPCGSAAAAPCLPVLGASNVGHLTCLTGSCNKCLIGCATANHDHESTKYLYIVNIKRRKEMTFNSLVQLWILTRAEKQMQQDRKTTMNSDGVNVGFVMSTYF